MNNNRDDFEATVLRLCSWCDYATVWRVFATRKKKKERGEKNYFLTTFHSGQVEDWLRSPDLRERNLLVIWRLTSIFVVNIHSGQMCPCDSVCVRRRIIVCTAAPLRLLSNLAESHLVQQPLPLTLAPPGRLHHWHQVESTPNTLGGKDARRLLLTHRHHGGPSVEQVHRPSS